jgi:aa3 type cytochrome c oxidase subunit IV
MADHGAPSYSTATGNDYEQHEQTYEGFVALFKYGTIGVALLLVLMFIFLT